MMYFLARVSVGKKGKNEKGKHAARRGRKATGLSSREIAGLPKGNWRAP
jgi:hypothetical protein